MTTTEKTKQKLVDSMRKSKTKVAATASTTQTQSTSATRTAAKKKKATTSAASRTKPRVSQTAKTVQDPYQSRGRVWPD
jgi:hypothetical protein